MQHCLLKLESGIMQNNSMLDIFPVFELYSNTRTSVVVWPNSRSTVTKQLEVILSCKCLYDTSKSQRVTKSRNKRPWLAHLSKIATADMQMLCNIFLILSLQLMKGSSFEQVLVLKKKNVVFILFFFLLLLSLFYHIWAWQSIEHDHLNKFSILFQQ